MSVAAVIVAGGRGTRVGGATRKQYLEVEGAPILLRAVRPFLAHPGIAGVVVVLPPEDADAPPPWLSGLAVRIVPGGETRADSVWSGLGAVDPAAEVVLVHDGARPFVASPLIQRVLEGARTGGVVAAIPVTDTLKEVDDGGRVLGTPDRARLWRAQTPQGFPRAALVEAYRRAREEGFAGTDDAAVFERYAGSVRVVAGDEGNLKITVTSDLAVARCLALAAAPGVGE